LAQGGSGADDAFGGGDAEFALDALAVFDLDTSLEGKTVIVVEDILDTGLTLKYLLHNFEERKPKHLRVAVLLDKTERRITDVHADYRGFEIPNKFVVGYGLDYSERYRNLRDVRVLSLHRKEPIS